MTAETSSRANGAAGLCSEVEAFWRGIPDKGLFFGLFAGWLALFHFLGNANLGYINTRSLFGWLFVSYTNPDDAHGFLIPFVVLGLLWWKRSELLALPKRSSWPPGFLLLFASLLHILGFMVQQTRLSVIGFFLGLYAIMGLTWGRQWMRATFPSFSLFVFSIPLNTLAEVFTVKLRYLATTITSGVCHLILGINVIQEGNRIFDANGAYQYEVAAACSGMRSLAAIFAIAAIYAFINFKSAWRMAMVIASAIPLAIGANVLRLVSIIVASEVFSPAAGKYVHENEWISLVPYLPAMLGLLLVGRWLREGGVVPPPGDPSGIAVAPQKS